MTSALEPRRVAQPPQATSLRQSVDMRPERSEKASDPAREKTPCVERRNSCAHRGWWTLSSKSKINLHLPFLVWRDVRITDVYLPTHSPGTRVFWRFGFCWVQNSGIAEVSRAHRHEV